MASDMDPEVEAVLVKLVEANERVERHERRFISFSTFQSAGLRCRAAG